jgi:uncharacterized protein (DUF697 family)
MLSVMRRQNTILLLVLGLALMAIPGCGNSPDFVPAPVPQDCAYAGDTDCEYVPNDTLSEPDLGECAYKGDPECGYMPDEPVPGVCAPDFAGDPARRSPNTAVAKTPEETIRAACWAAAGLGVPGVLNPGLDEAGIAAIWSTMVLTIAKQSGASVSPATAAKLATSAVSSVAAYTLGSKILSWMVIFAIPGGGIPAAMAANAGLNALFTFRLGRESMRRFSNPQFTSVDVMQCAKHLIAIPTWAEIREVKQILAGH